MKTETAITWKNSGLAYMAFRGNKLVAGIRQDSGHRGEWLLSLPEPSGFFAVVRSFETLKTAMRHVEAIELGQPQ
jgi:hypothetical protein